MKKVISLLLCAALAFTATVSANAANSEPEKKRFECLGETVVLDNNTVLLSASGIEPSTYDYCVKFEGLETKNQYTEQFRNVTDAPLKMTLPSAEKYKMYMRSLNKGGTASTEMYDFSETGGVYKKIRIKLNDFDPEYFNEDGTHTLESAGGSFEHNYNYNYQPVGSEGEYFASALVFKSGAAVTAVAPDENGMVEVYVSAKIGQTTTYLTDHRYRLVSNIGAGGSVLNAIDLLRFGDIDANCLIDINDVTVLQMYIAGLKKFDELAVFRADTNVDDNIDVTDVTFLQFALAEGINFKY